MSRIVADFFENFAGRRAKGVAGAAAGRPQEGVEKLYIWS